MTVENYVERARKDGASDIHLVRGLTPRYRVDGAIREMEGAPLTSDDCLVAARELAGSEIRHGEAVGELDLALTIAGVRCRVNLFRQQEAWSAAIRLLNDHIPDLSELGLPKVVGEFPAYSQGLVLITGETGVGKELFASALHANSKRAEGPFITVDCTTLPETLVEAHLFGHARGAFTGADRAREGLLAAADQGTLFLDEITECSPEVQASLLRVLENRMFYRVGGTRPVSVDFRLVTASNRSLNEAVESGRFRRDLYFRISSIVVNVPPLRERKEDISALSFYYLHYFAHRHGRVCVPKFSQENFQKILGYSWPGNVRELKNVIVTASIQVVGKETEARKTHASQDRQAVPGEARGNTL